MTAPASGVGDGMAAPADGVEHGMRRATRDILRS